MVKKTYYYVMKTKSILLKKWQIGKIIFFSVGRSITSNVDETISTPLQIFKMNSCANCDPNCAMHWCVSTEEVKTKCLLAEPSWRPTCGESSLHFSSNRIFVRLSVFRFDHLYTMAPKNLILYVGGFNRAFSPRMFYQHMLIIWSSP